MHELTLIIDNCSHKELKDYLLFLNGILEVIINNEDNLKIYVKYDYNLTNIEIIKGEILLFLNILRIPSIIFFDKHPKFKTSEYKIVIKDLCCEWCLKSIIEELLMTDGIESSNSDFNYYDKKDVVINIKYDSNLINQYEILKLESKFNN